MTQLFRSDETVPELSRSLAHLTGRTNMAIWRYITHQTYALGSVTGMQASVLLFLQGQQNLTSNALARHYRLRPSAITRLVDRLEKQGLVARIPSGNDRRVAYIRATDKGEALAAEIAPVFDRSVEVLLDGLAPREVKTLCSCLRHILLKARAEEEIEPVTSPGANLRRLAVGWDE